MTYTDQGRVEAYLQRDLTASEEVLFDEVVNYISSFVSNYCNREWIDIEGEDPTAEAKLFDGTGHKELFINDFNTLTKVEILDYSGAVSLTLTASTEFITYPLNSTVKQSIRLRNYTFPKGSANARITAIFSSFAVPEDIIIVATTLVSDYLSNSGEQIFKRESIEGYSRELVDNTSKDAQKESLLKTLDRWKKILI